MQENPVYLNHLGIVCASGTGSDAVWQALQQARSSPLRQSSQWTGHPVYVGEVTDELPPLTDLPPHQRSRNNQLLQMAWQQIQQPFAALTESIPAERIGIILGSSTSGINEAYDTIKAWKDQGTPADKTRYAIQEISAPAMTLADWSGAKGPQYTISTACSSGSKALASARRLLQQNVCDLVIAGGVDSLAHMTVNGFASLESLSAGICQPFSRNRDGINIGEGAALFIMSRESGPVMLKGAGETSDAHHISAPHPDGDGAAAAMQQALQQAGMTAAGVSYINLHGTATEQNDRMESRAVSRVFGHAVPVSSTKALTGHTLGAAGAVEAAFCWLALQGDGQLPPHIWDNQPDPELPELNYVSAPLAAAPDCVLSNSFAFGGNNISLLFGRT